MLAVAAGPGVTAAALCGLPATAAGTFEDTLRGVTGLLAGMRATAREVPRPGVVATMGIRD